MVLSLLVLSVIISSSVTAQTESGDAIAIRVMPNSSHNSPVAWYTRNVPNTGSPSSVIVDGYEGVRDGRTVYISAANIKDNNVYTNIYIISYSNNSDDETNDIFGQILKNWQFNVELVASTPSGICMPAEASPCNSDGTCANRRQSCQLDDNTCYQYCTLSSDCDSGKYCNSVKAGLIRDVKRMADLYEVELAIKQHEANNKSYPQLLSGTYLTSKTISTWPSWSENLGKQLGFQIPKDPINRLGECPSGHDRVTCWNEKDKKFATNFMTPILPTGSRAYVYQWLADTKEFVLCTYYETDFNGLAERFSCGSDINQLKQNVIDIKFGNLESNKGPFEAYFRADGPYAIDWNKTIITPLDDKFAEVTWSDWSGWVFFFGKMLLTMTNDPAVVSIRAKDVDLGNNSFGQFNFKVEVFDVMNNYGSEIGTIKICTPKRCTGNMCGKLSDNCGGTLICGDCPSGFSCNQSNFCQQDPVVNPNNNNNNNTTP